MKNVMNPLGRSTGVRFYDHVDVGVSALAIDPNARFNATNALLATPNEHVFLTPWVGTTPAAHISAFATFTVTGFAGAVAVQPDLYLFAHKPVLNAGVQIAPFNNAPFDRTNFVQLRAQQTISANGPLDCFMAIQGVPVAALLIFPLIAGLANATQFAAGGSTITLNTLYLFLNDSPIRPGL